MLQREKRPLSALEANQFDFGPWQGDAQWDLAAQSYFFSSVAQFVEGGKRASKTQKAIEMAEKAVEKRSEQRPPSRKKKQGDSKTRRSAAKSIDEFSKKPSGSMKKCSSRDTQKHHRVFPSTQFAFLQKCRQATSKTTQRLDSESHVIFEKLFQPKPLPPRIPTAKRKFLAQDTQSGLTKKSISSCQYFNKLNDRMTKKTHFQNE